jgi:uncharacterized protein YndB with AHSA1/START domain
MATGDLQHATFVFERTTTAPIDRVFGALANPIERAEWGAPSEKDALVYEETDFSVGGQDRFRCGPKHDPQFRGVTTYLDIVSNSRIVSTEVVAANGRNLVATLSTTTLESRGAGTAISVTVQVASLAGEDMLEGVKSGTGASLDNLVASLA